MLVRPLSQAGLRGLMVAAQGLARAATAPGLAQRLAQRLAD
jgi:hypothetical protein